MDIVAITKQNSFKAVNVALKLFLVIYTLRVTEWWSRGGLNPCPKTYSHRHLRAQSFINDSLRRKANDSPNGFGSFIRHA